MAGRGSGHRNSIKKISAIHVGRLTPLQSTAAAPLHIMICLLFMSPVLLPMPPRGVSPMKTFMQHELFA